MENPVETAATIEKMAADGMLAELEFLYIRSNVLFRVTMTADRIRSFYEYKLAVRDVSAASQRLRTFITAMRATTFTATNSRLDVRYGFIARDTHSREVMAIFMDFSSQLVLINGQAYRAKGELSKWFMDYARTITKLM